MANNLETEKKVMAVSMLAEGNSIRSIERMTNIHRDTIMRLGVRVGEACVKIQDEKMRGLICPQIEVDEIWGFIGAKRKNAPRTGPVALNFAYYNFCKVHGAIRCTPAMEAGIENSQWTVAELVERCGE